MYEERKIRNKKRKTTNQKTPEAAATTSGQQKKKKREKKKKIVRQRGVIFLDRNTRKEKQRNPDRADNTSAPLRMITREWRRCTSGSQTAAAAAAAAAHASCLSSLKQVMPRATAEKITEEKRVAIQEKEETTMKKDWLKTKRQEPPTLPPAPAPRLGCLTLLKRRRGWKRHRRLLAARARVYREMRRAAKDDHVSGARLARKCVAAFHRVGLREGFAYVPITDSSSDSNNDDNDDSKEKKKEEEAEDDEWEEDTGDKDKLVSTGPVRDWHGGAVFSSELACVRAVYACALEIADTMAAGLALMDFQPTCPRSAAAESAWLAAVAAHEGPMGRQPRGGAPMAVVTPQLFAHVAQRAHARRSILPLDVQQYVHSRAFTYAFVHAYFGDGATLGEYLRAAASEDAVYHELAYLIALYADHGARAYVTDVAAASEVHRVCPFEDMSLEAYCLEVVPHVYSLVPPHVAVAGAIPVAIGEDGEDDEEETDGGGGDDVGDLAVFVPFIVVQRPSSVMAILAKYDFLEDLSGRYGTDTVAGVCLRLQMMTPTHVRLALAATRAALRVHAATMHLPDAPIPTGDYFDESAEEAIAVASARIKLERQAARPLHPWDIFFNNIHLSVPGPGIDLPLTRDARMTVCKPRRVALHRRRSDFTAAMACASLDKSLPVCAPPPVPSPPLPATALPVSVNAPASLKPSAVSHKEDTDCGSTASTSSSTSSSATEGYATDCTDQDDETETPPSPPPAAPPVQTQTPPRLATKATDEDGDDAPIPLGMMRNGKHACKLFISVH